MSSSATNVTPQPASTLLPEHSVVRLRLAQPASGLPAGAVGTIVHVYQGEAAYEVEFAESNKAPALETLLPADVELLISTDE